jgi:hypothetical protein
MRRKPREISACEVMNPSVLALLSTHKHGSSKYFLKLCQISEKFFTVQHNLQANGIYIW